MKTYNFIAIDKDQLTALFTDNEQPNRVTTLMEIVNTYENILIEGKILFGEYYHWRKIELSEITITTEGLYYRYFLGNDKTKIDELNVYVIDEENLDKYYDEDEDDYILEIKDDKDWNRKYIL